MGIALDMTSLLRMAMVAACDLPADMQGEITRLILAYPDESLLAPPGDDASAISHHDET